MALSGICHIEKRIESRLYWKRYIPSGMMNEQHIFCYAYYEGGYFYAKKQISRRYFHNYHGVRDGLYHDLLQHCSQRRRNE